MFCMLNCFLLILLTPHHTDSQDSDAKNIYFLRSGSQVNTSDLNELYEANAKSAIIDLTSVHAIQHVVVQFGIGVSLQVSTLSYLGGAVQKNRCSHPVPIKPSKKKLEYECKPTRAILIQGTTKKITLSSYKIYVENYIGCFEIKSQFMTSWFTNIKECESECRDRHFFGVNSNRQCSCISNLTQLTIVDLSLCNKSCSRIFPRQLCGADNILAVYSRGIFQKNQRLVSPSWECVTQGSDCVCPDGRTGINCEIINCSINNGNCGDLYCRRSSFLEVDYQVCTCLTGFYLDNNLNCIDMKHDELDRSNECRSPCINGSTCVNEDGNFTCKEYANTSTAHSLPTKSSKDRFEDFDLMNFSFVFAFASLPSLGVLIYLLRHNPRKASTTSSMSSRF